MGLSVHGSLLSLDYPRCLRCSAQDNAVRGIHFVLISSPRDRGHIRSNGKLKELLRRVADQ